MNVAALFQPIWMCSLSLFGLFFGGWSPASVLVCFWFEKLTRVTLMGARILIHRNATRARGHYRSQLGYGGEAAYYSTSTLTIGGKTYRRDTRDGTGGAKVTFFSEYVVLVVVAETIAVGALYWALGKMIDWTGAVDRIDFVRQEWQSKAWLVVAPLVVEFVYDVIVRLRARSFAALKIDAITTMSSSNLLLTAFLAMLAFSAMTKSPHVFTFAVVLLLGKLIYECSLVVFGRDWEHRMNESTELDAVADEKAANKVKSKRSRQREDDERPL
jgi:hypothetical protein